MTFSSDDKTHTLDVSLRHVWQSSGWYGLAGTSKFESGLSNDDDVYFFGVGKYIGESTALDFKVLSSDLIGLDIDGYALSLSHVGSIGSQWQYAADLGYSISDFDWRDAKSYSVGLSLFPTDRFEFGVQAVHQEFDYSPDRDSYEGFVGWFVRDNIQVRAQYRDDDIDYGSESDFDSNQFGIGVNVRF